MTVSRLFLNRIAGILYFCYLQVYFNFRPDTNVLGYKYLRCFFFGILRRFVNDIVPGDILSYKAEQEKWHR